MHHSLTCSGRQLKPIPLAGMWMKTGFSCPSTHPLPLPSYRMKAYILKQELEYSTLRGKLVKANPYTLEITQDTPTRPVLRTTHCEHTQHWLTRAWIRVLCISTKDHLECNCTAHLSSQRETSWATATLHGRLSLSDWRLHSAHSLDTCAQLCPVLKSKACKHMHHSLTYSGSRQLVLCMKAKHVNTCSIHLHVVERRWKTPLFLLEWRCLNEDRLAACPAYRT